MAERTMVGIREDVMVRVEAYREAVQERTGLPVTVTDAVRLLLLAGLDVQTKMAGGSKPARRRARASDAVEAANDQAAARRRIGGQGKRARAK